MRVKEAMSKEPHIIKPDTSLREAARIMRDCDCSYLPVGKNDRLTGALTDRDITVRAVAEGRDPETTTAGDVMTRNIRYCFEEDSLKDAAEHMKAHHIRRLVVLNRDKHMTGILSVDNIACKDAKLVGTIANAVCHEAA